MHVRNAFFDCFLHTREICILSPIKQKMPKFKKSKIIMKFLMENLSPFVQPKTFERVVAEVQAAVSESVIEDEDDLLYGEAAPSLFAATLTSEPVKEANASKQVTRGWFLK